jgi:hypothetical protein
LAQALPDHRRSPSVAIEDPARRASADCRQ